MDGFRENQIINSFKESQIDDESKNLNEDLLKKDNSNEQEFPKFLQKIPRPWKILAPMVSNSEEAYRDLARKYGAQICYTEMVHCRIYNESKSKPNSNIWFTTSLTDRPLVIQICGNDPEEMLKACLSLQDYCDAIDINFGCPQDIARKGHYGSFLMDDFDLVEKIVSTLAKNLSVPLFCKMRVFESIEKTIEFAKLLERSGCKLLVVHGRTKEQRGQKTGFASLLHIKVVKETLDIPVVANGGMIYYHNIDECLSYTKCDGVMIAEPHLYNPMIFIGDYLSTCFDVLTEYYQIIKEFPQKASQKHIKSHSFKILKRILEILPEFRQKLDSCYGIDDYLSFIGEIRSEAIRRGFKEDYFRMKPYIRKEYLNKND